MVAPLLLIRALAKSSGEVFLSLLAMVESQAVSSLWSPVRVILVPAASFPLPVLRACLRAMSWWDLATQMSATLDGLSSARVPRLDKLGL